MLRTPDWSRMTPELFPQRIADTLAGRSSRLYPDWSGFGPGRAGVVRVARPGPVNGAERRQESRWMVQRC
ncbi:hypothetical protein [Nonomuraea basaltis]|uniref:hypothetical protein n=1 Tax=Nonomuraea basaltis TaxID=2495887 RepID=UPI00110C68B2|nr:hypothetical protein [Nonomuraea basaltis]TMR89156.1 hypothetical protein EJK15_62285 [Nonomuraea basaltis]